MRLSDIQLIINNDGGIIKCNFTMLEYEKSDEAVVLVPFADSLKDTFRVAEQSIPTSLKIYNAQLCFIAGFSL